MFVTDDMIARLATEYGAPKEWSFDVAVERKEYDRIRRSQRGGRRHDFTVYVIKDNRVVVIAKHFYPPGLYRAPSGGLIPDEDPKDGMLREIWEETGCRAEIGHFMLSTTARFACGDDVIHWHSYVFEAAYVDGDFNFTDTREIREVRLAELSEFDTFAKIMRSINVGGLHYRAALHEQVAPLLSVKD